MSTALNDVVFELYKELYKEFESKQNKMLQEMQQNSCRARLKRVIKNPGRIFTKLSRDLKALFPDEYEKFVRSNSSKWNADVMKANVFMPTSKKFPDVKIAVYTCITGGYDELKEPFYADDAIDYYAVSDFDGSVTGEGVWNFIPVPPKLKNLSSVKQQRYVKLHPDEFIGKNYDYTFYIDGSLRITCDIKPLIYSLIDDGRSMAIHVHSTRDCIYDEAMTCCAWNRLRREEAEEQMNFYRREGMPEHFGLLESPVIIRKSNDSEINYIMSEWWQQIERFTHRDQLSLPYVLWKNGMDISCIYSLGNNVWKSPYYIYYKHNL